MSARISTVVTKRADTMPHSTNAETPAAMPANVRVVAMHAVYIVLVRCARVYVQTVAGIMTAGGLGMDSGILPNDLLALLLMAMQLAAAPVCYTALMNAGELLAKLDQTSPQWRA